MVCKELYTQVKNSVFPSWNPESILSFSSLNESRWRGQGRGLNKSFNSMLMYYQLLENVGYDEGVCLTSVRRIKNNQEHTGHMTHDRAEFSGGFTQGGAAEAEGSWSSEKGEK